MMANIRIDLDHSVPIGVELTFKAPCDCSEVTGLKIYSPDVEEGKEYPFIDANGNNISTLDNLFKAGSMVKVLINNDKAQIVNGDTNGYIEAKFEDKAPNYSYGTEDLTAGTSELETGKLHFVYE